MTVAELIEALKALPQDLKVRVRAETFTSDAQSVEERPSRYWRPGMPPPVVPNHVVISDDVRR